MNQEGSGALENFDMGNRISELIQTLGAEGGVNKVKDGYTPAHQNETTEKSQSQSTSTLVDGEHPHLPPPNARIMNSGNNLGQNLANAEIENIQSVATKTSNNGEAISESAQLAAYAETAPSTKALRHLVGNDKASLKLINQFFQSQGIKTPVSPQNPHLPEAVEASLTKMFKKSGVLAPQAKAQSITSAAEANQTMTTFFTGLQNIDTQGKTVNHIEAAAKLQKTTISAQALVETIVNQLKNDSSVPGETKMSLLNYLKLIGDLISKLRQELFEMSLQDSRKAQQMSAVISETTQKKIDAISKQYLDMFQQLKLKSQMDFIQNRMKILNYTMSGVGIGVAALMLPLNPVMGLMMLGVMITWFSTTTALQETGKMQEIFRNINNSLGGEMGKIFFWVAALSALTLGALFLAVLPGVGAMVPTLLVPAIMLILSDSQVMNTIMDKIQQDTGMSDRLKAILTGVAMLATSIVIMAATELAGIFRELGTEVVKFVVQGAVKLVLKVLATIATAGAGAIVSILVTIISVVMRVVETVGRVLTEMAKALFKLFSALQKLSDQLAKGSSKAIEIAQKIIQKIVQLTQSFHKFLIKASDQFDEFKDFLDDINDIVNSNIFKEELKSAQWIKEKLSDVKDKFDEVKGGIKQYRDKIDKVGLQFLEILQISGEAGKQAAKIIEAVGTGGVQLKIADITAEEGEIQYLIHLLENIINSLRDLLAKLEGKDASGPGQFREQIDSLSQLFNQLMESMQNVSERLTSASTI